MHNKALLAIIVISLILGAFTLTRGQIWGDDFASYIMQAESILTGTTREFVEHNSFTIFESSSQIGPIAYPWGYPLILTPVLALKGMHPLALKLPGLFFYAGFLVCLYRLLAPRLTPTESLLIVSLFAFNPLLLGFLDQILSDIPFLFFSTLTLLLMTDTRRQTRGRLLGIGALLAVDYFIRTTGVLLLAAFVATLLLDAFTRRRDRQVLKSNLKDAAIVFATFGVLFLVNILLFPEGETSHLLRFGEFNIATALGFAREYFSVFGLFLGENLFWQIVYYILFVFFLIGAWTRRTQDVLFIVFVVIWMLLLIAWPAWQGSRLIFPLLPIFIYFTFAGMKFILAKLPQEYARPGQWLYFVFWWLIAIYFLFTSSLAAYSNLQNGRTINGPFDSYSQEVYEYIREDTPADSVIVFFKPRAMRLMTHHDTLMSTECDRVLKGDYLVLSKKVGRNQQIPPEEIGACNLPLEQVLTNNRFIVYRIQK